MSALIAVTRVREGREGTALEMADEGQHLKAIAASAAAGPGVSRLLGAAGPGQGRTSPSSPWNPG